MLPDDERDIQVRLVDEVHARLEVVTEAARAGHVPREIVAELVFVLLGRLRRVDVVADRHPVRVGLLRRTGARRIWFPKSAYWKMNSFSFDPGSTQLWFRLIELNSLSLSPQFSGTSRGAAA